ncbi:hypothetical protein [Lachnospira multipara]|jgi:UPF0755 protein|uniref:hypothetical protein n=1 Tax=Lachnospira multipara TaxID=28051 RepID=UPI00048633F9|nr:hypothetical protein [Lachnospira multipara]
MSNKNIRLITAVSVNVLVILIGIIVIYKVGSDAYNFGNNIFNEVSADTSNNAREVEVTINSGISAKELANTFYEKGLVNDKKLFYYQILVSDYKDKWVDGTYKLTTDMLPTDMLKVICVED